MVSYIDALNFALDDALAVDEDVFIYGQDIGEFGGAFKVTKGLFEKYPGRIIDSPISEDAMVGLCVGAALGGKKPILEMQFSDFASCGYNQIINQAGTQFYRTNIPCQIVIRLPIGGTPGGGPFHSQSPESIYAHYPGLVVVAPSFPQDAYDILRESINLEDPVIFCENKYIYQRAKQSKESFSRNLTSYEVKKGEAPKFIGRSKVIKTGSHATVVAYGAMMLELLKADIELKKNGHDIEIIDLRTIKPIDIGTILASVSKTGRLLCISETFPWGGVNSEIIKEVVQNGFSFLDAPPMSLNAKDTPIPFHPDLWDVHRPNSSAIYKKILDLLNY